MSQQVDRNGSSRSFSQAAITEPGALPSIEVADRNQITCIYSVSGGNAVLRLEGSIDGTNWINLDPDGDTSAEAGTDGFFVEVGVNLVRLNWISGSATTVSAQWRIR